MEDETIDEGQETGEESSQETAEEADYKKWFSGLDKSIQDRVTKQYSRLENAFTRVKEERTTLKGQIAAIKADTTKTVEEKISEISARTEEAEKRASFYENLPPNIVNPKNAYILAQANNCLKKDGSLDLEKFKKACPEQLGRKGTDTRGGSGSSSDPSSADMNTRIREMAGYG